MDNKEVMQQALEALCSAVEPKKGKVYAREFEPIDCYAMHEQAITALRKALAQEHAFPVYKHPPAAKPEQEPCIGKDLRCPCQDGDACHYKDCGNTKARTVAQPEQEPVAWLKEDWTGGHLNYESVYEGAFAAFPVYRHPPAAQRPWVGLTDEDMKDPKTHILDFIYGARWAEAKLKEKNDH